MLGSASKKALTAGRGLRGALALALTAIVTTSAGGCGLLGGDDTSSSGGDGNLEKSKIKVAVMSTIDTTPFRLPQDGGYFKADGLDVEAVEAATGQVSLTKLIGGEVKNGDIDAGFLTEPFITQATS